MEALPRRQLKAAAVCMKFSQAVVYTKPKFMDMWKLFCTPANMLAAGSASAVNSRSTLNTTAPAAKFIRKKEDTGII